MTTNHGSRQQQIFFFIFPLLEHLEEPDNKRARWRRKYTHYTTSLSTKWISNDLLKCIFMCVRVCEFVDSVHLRI